MVLRRQGADWYFTKRLKGRRFCVSLGASDLRTAQARAAETEHDIRAGLSGWRNVPRLAAWWDVYRTAYKPAQVKHPRAARVIQGFIAVYGRRRLDRVSRKDVAQFLSGRANRNSRQRKADRPLGADHRLERRALQAIFDSAIEGGYDIRDPLSQH